MKLFIITITNSATGAVSEFCQFADSIATLAIEAVNLNLPITAIEEIPADVTPVPFPFLYKQQ